MTDVQMKLLGMGVIMMKDNFICREHRAHMLLHHGSKEMAAQVGHSS